MQLVENAVVAGRFRLNRLIGQGGMGSVWQATHLGLDIPCAVKFIEGAMANLAESQTRFEREAKAAAQLRSPHVVQILDHGICEGTPYIAMELLDGEDLGKRFARLGPMHPAQLHNYIAQVCRALTKAHAVGIVHRDLKPDNIFLVRDDDREIAKVLDFGIAKSASSELGGSQTKTGAMLGTPYYMSPEQAQGTKAVDFRSDLWSLGVIVYQGLTGRLPFESEALGDLLIKIMVTELPLPSRLGYALPGFDSWWLRAASRDPAQRFQSAKEFADSLALVCGVSQLSGVHERPAPVGMSPSGTMPIGQPAGQAPAYGPPPQQWQPGPQHAGGPPPGAAPYGPPAGASAYGPPPGATGGFAAAPGATPPPMSTTYAGGEPVASRGRGALYAGLGVVALLVLAGGGALLLRAQSASKAAAVAAAGSATPDPAASAAPSAAPVASAAPATPQADPVAPAAPGTGAAAVADPPVASAKDPRPQAPPVAATPQAASPHGARPAAGHKPASSKPAAPAELGF